MWVSGEKPFQPRAGSADVPSVSPSRQPKTDVLRMMIRRLLVLVVGLLFSVSAIAAAPDEETFESLTVGTNVYSKVTVLNKTRVDLFIRHSKGMANLKVKDLDPSIQARLGYQVEQPMPSKVDQVLKVANVQQMQEQLEADPHYQEMEARFANHLGDAIEKFDERAAHIVIGAPVVAAIACSELNSRPSRLVATPVAV